MNGHARRRVPLRPALPVQALKRSLAAALLAALGGCVVVPQTRQVYDPGCQALTRQVTLEMAVIGQFQSCHGDECALMLASAGLVTAVSAVVSGSIALVGNVVYWIELQGRCKPRRPGPDPAPTPPPIPPAVPR